MMQRNERMMRRRTQCVLQHIGHQSAVRCPFILIVLMLLFGKKVGAKPYKPLQVFHITNMLSNASSLNNGAGITKTSVVVALYNGSAAPCFHIRLSYADTMSLGTGGLSPCVAPVQMITATPIAGPYGAIWQAPATCVIDPSYTILNISVTSQTGPAFDSSNDLVTQLGMSQFLVQAQ